MQKRKRKQKQDATEVLPAMRLKVELCARLDAVVAALAREGLDVARTEVARMAIEAGLPALEKKWKVG